MAKKRFGQNFLSNKAYLRRMAGLINEASLDGNLLEIGPGKGALTEYIIEAPAVFRAVEIDVDLYPILEEKFSSYSQFELIKSDILKYDFDVSEDYVVVGNVPYYISFDILEYVIKNISKSKIGFFTFQKEFAQKACAEVGTKEYAFLTVFLAMFFECKYEFKIPASAFNPRPKIDSAFMSIKRLEDPLYKGDDLKALKHFLRSIFSQRRKKLNNVLSKLKKNYSPQLLEECGIAADARPEAVTPEQFAQLFSKLS